jgi:hypothetical protein
MSPGPAVTASASIDHRPWKRDDVEHDAAAVPPTIYIFIS